jgi:hypothetical protein
MCSDANFASEGVIAVNAPVAARISESAMPAGDGVRARLSLARHHARAAGQSSRSFGRFIPEDETAVAVRERLGSAGDDGGVAGVRGVS